MGFVSVHIHQNSSMSQPWWSIFVCDAVHCPESSARHNSCSRHSIRPTADCQTQRRIPLRSGFDTLRSFTRVDKLNSGFRFLPGHPNPWSFVRGTKRNSGFRLRATHGVRQPHTSSRLTPAVAASAVIRTFKRRPGDRNPGDRCT